MRLLFICIVRFFTASHIQHAACTFISLIMFLTNFSAAPTSREISHIIRPKQSIPCKNDSQRTGYTAPSTSLSTEDNNVSNTERLCHFLLSFHNLTYSVKLHKKFRCLEYLQLKKSWTSSNNHKVLLNDISGEAREGEVLAILGPSGSGKSTLIDALAGRISKDRLIGGIVTLNGEALESKLLRVISAYVMQDDLLFPMLTVEETLMFSAEFRLPRSFSKSKKKARVRALIEQLGLQSAANTLIGDEGHRGVSGGERRRASIGIDIIHDPIILFLDEPTSGLDSTSAFKVVQVLKRIARSGSIVVLSIHQPSFRVLHLLDHLLFLSSGQTIYSGSPADLPRYFADFGHPIPENENRAEFVVDLILQLEDSPPNGTENLIEFHKSWSEKKSSEQQNSSTSSGTGSAKLTTLNDALKASISEGRLFSRTTNSTDLNPSTTVSGFANSIWVEIYVLAKRSLKNSLRMPELFAIRFLAIVVTGTMLASIFWHLDESPKGAEERVGFIASAITTIFYTCAGSIPSFIQERFIFIRETAYNSYRRISYILSHVVTAFPPLILLAFIFTSITFSTVGLSGGLSGYIFYTLIIVSSFWAGDSFVTLISLIASNVMLGYIAAVTILAQFVLFSGFFIASNRIPIYWVWFHYLSLVKYPYEATLQNEFGGKNPKCFVRGIQMFDNTPFREEGRDVKMELLKSISDTLGVDINNNTCVVSGIDELKQRGVSDLSKWNCLWVTIGWGVLFRVVSYLFLVLFGSKNRTR